MRPSYVVVVALSAALARAVGPEPCDAHAAPPAARAPDRAAEPAPAPASAPAADTVVVVCVNGWACDGVHADAHPHPPRPGRR